MAQRRGQAQAHTTKTRKTEPVEDFDFLASQQSTGSDDNALQLAVAQQLMASKEKKRKEMEKKFFAAAKSRLTNEMAQAAEEVKSTVEATELVYAKFILDYAAAEDAIRALWTEIKKEQDTLLDVAKRQRAANEELRKGTEKAQIVGMAQVKEACHETRSIIETLLPSSGE
ncbi:hypothetical protein DFH07DRAFT_1064202 [Mycena maculata]|uniref:Uncharacterized protein n=1 Tax=Mycena maculata TaxID=230809 RepID=A0AAD7IDP7_9AGAR|nr:hypothetical protein DFH07DRAFT_1064202 [Mycena maculata]